MPKKYPSDFQKKYLVRFPPGLKEKMQDIAGERGLNSEIIRRLEWSFREEEKPPGDLLAAAIKLAEDLLDSLRRLSMTLKNKKF